MLHNRLFIHRFSTLRVLLVVVGLPAAIGCAGNRNWTPAAVARVLRDESHDLGARHELARYGRKNPDCWSLDTAPTKARRRLQTLIRQGISPRVRLCQAEYVRRGTHDDILVKVFVLPSAHDARQTLETPFLKDRHRRLTRHGLPQPVCVRNLVLYIIGSETNFSVIPAVFRRIRTALLHNPKKY